MKKYLRYANLFTLAAGLIGMLLLCWLYAVGTDERGLYPANHIAWILTGILTTAFVVASWVFTGKAGNSRSYRQNFPASIPAAVGCAAAAVGLLVGGYQAISMKNLLGLLTGVAGVLGGICMVLAAVCRFLGHRNKLPVHALPCFFFALQLFLLGQEYGSEPEMYRYLYRFWATVSMVPACYWLWSFDVNMGKRTTCLFWCLVAGYCNLVAVSDGSHRLMHICMALWMLTALPRLQYLPKLPRSTPQAAPVTPEAVAEAAPAEPEAAEEAPQPQTPPPAEEPAPQAPEAELPDPESILEQLLRDFGQQDET